MQDACTAAALDYDVPNELQGTYVCMRNSVCLSIVNNT